MRRWVGWILLACILAGGAVLCAVRWEAWFGNPAELEWTEEEITHQFITFNNDSVLRALQCDTLSFLLLGDIHNSLNNEDMKLLLERHPDVQFLAQLGDWMERPYHYYEQMMYQSIVGTGFDSLPVMAIPGNHEYLKGIPKTLPVHWKEIFPNPHNGPTRFMGTTYFVDFPHARLIAIDTDGLHRISDYTQVAFWLKKTLRDASDKFTIVMMHHPIYSTAEGRSNPLIWLNFHGSMREADVVFSGHDHNYARRTEYYKARFWKREEPTIFIGTNASKKVYPTKQKAHHEASFSGEAVYELLKIVPDTLYIHTYKQSTGELIDEVVISHYIATSSSVVR